MTQRLVVSCVAVLLLILLGPSDQRVRAEPPPVTGKAVPRLRHLDQVMLDIVREHNFAGASLAVARNGKLVFAHGYGWANREDQQPVRPHSRFNLASCSKPITASAILKLVDQGKLRLDDRVLPLLGEQDLPAGSKMDPRLRTVTLRQLLHHAGGLARPVGPVPQVARHFKIEPPVTISQAVQFHLSQPLLFDPGTQAQYSNFGFILLRRVVERVSGQEYETFTARNVLKPMGISDARLDLMEGYLPLEVHRYSADGKCHPGGHGQLQGCAGCWVLSTSDAVRFLTSLDGSRGPRVLSERAYRQMLEPLPTLPLKKGARHNGLGWDVVERSRAGVFFEKNGGVAGISTWMEHLPDGTCWAAFFNGGLKDEKDHQEGQRPARPGVKAPWPIIRKAIQATSRWPDIDLFESE